VIEVSFYLTHPREQLSPNPSPEDENRSSFQNVAFLRIMDDRDNPKTQ
jgi:hypothetical protein